MSYSDIHTDASGYSLKNMAASSISSISTNVKEGVKEIAKFLYVPFQCCKRKLVSCSSWLEMSVTVK